MLAAKQPFGTLVLDEKALGIRKVIAKGTPILRKRRTTVEAAKDQRLPQILQKIPCCLGQFGAVRALIGFQIDVACVGKKRYHLF